MRLFEQNERAAFRRYSVFTLLIHSFAHSIIRCRRQQQQQY